MVCHSYFVRQEQKVKETLKSASKPRKCPNSSRKFCVPVEKVVMCAAAKDGDEPQAPPGLCLYEMVLLDEDNRFWKSRGIHPGTPGKNWLVGGDGPMPVTPDEIRPSREQISESEETEKRR